MEIQTLRQAIFEHFARVPDVSVVGSPQHNAPNETLQALAIQVGELLSERQTVLTNLDKLQNGLSFLGKEPNNFANLLPRGFEKRGGGSKGESHPIVSRRGVETPRGPT